MVGEISSENQRQTEVCRTIKWVTWITNNSVNNIDRISILRIRSFSLLIGLQARYQELWCVNTKPKRKDWLVDQLKRINHEARESDSPDLKKWLEDVENLNRAWFVKFEDIMHKVSTGPMWMKDERIADVVAESLRKLDGEAYRLDAYSVMSNHVHAVFKPFLSEKDLRESFDPEGRLIFTSKHPSLSRIMQSLKGSTSRECNRLLSRTGQFWEHESFD